MFRKLFIDHPEQTGETYWQHLCFTAKTAFELVSIGFVLIVHGLLPFLYTTSASKRIIRLHDIVSARARKTQALPHASALRKAA